MKNNTKLIMETWRRFLKEGPEGIDEDGMAEEMHDELDPLSLSPVEDADLEGDLEKIDQLRGEQQPFDDEYNPGGDPDMDLYGDPAHIGRDSAAPMLGASGDDGEVYAGDDSIGPYYTDDEDYVTDDDSSDPDIAGSWARMP